RCCAQGRPKGMSDDEGRLLIDDIQDGSGSIDHELPASTLVDMKSAQGDTENTSINKLSTPLTVPVFGQPQVTSSGEVHFHSGTPSNVQRHEPSPFAFTNNLAKMHCEQETSSTNNTSSPKHRKKPQQETSSSVFALRSDNNHSLATTPRSSLSSHDCNSLQGDGSVNGKRQKRSKGRNDTQSSRKRKDSSFDEPNRPDSPVEHEETTSKKHKPLQRDRGTCVHSKAVQSETDCPLFDLEVGATRLVEMTVVCKMENNELYVVAKWKDQEFSGILTDGHPPAYLPYMKKRCDLRNLSTTVASSGSNSSNGSACGDSNDRATGSGASTPSKSRQQPTTPRDAKKRIPSSEMKRKLSCSITRPGSSLDPPDDEEDLDVDTSANGSVLNLDSFKLVEVPGRKSMHVCPVDGCQHRYSRSEEMEYHKATVHAKKAVMFEAICCQTDISAFRRRSVETDVEGLARSESPCPSTTLGEVPVKHENSASTSMESQGKLEESSKSPAGYSDISDDGVAPQLQKEEPTTDVRTPLLISTGIPSSSVTEPANVLTSPEFAPSPREAAAESLPPTPQQPKVSRPSSMPMDPATPTSLPSSFQPVSADRNRGAAMNGVAVNPIVNAAVTPTPVSAIAATRLPVTPSPGGMYMPSFAHQMMPPYAPQLAATTPTANAAASPQQQQQLNKIPQQHMKASDDVAASSGVLSAAKAMQSPAAQNLQRQFGMQMMPSGTGQHQAAMMQAAAAQAQMAQMHHLYMQQMAAGARGAQYPLAGTSAGAHEMAQLVALQALQQQQQNHFASMFQQK
uniref:C2H2-type domain-containing protein n=1 Tax=Haemonchus contortus TaxID=6289 RepID=A0A7I4XTC4_HAECO